MKNKKNLLYLIIIFILGLFIMKFGYSYLTSTYEDENNSFIKSPDSNLPSVEKTASDFTVYNLDGDKISLSDYTGNKPVVINFWASWCTPCKSEMPYFDEAYSKYNDSVEILMVNLTDGQRETKDTALDFINSNNYKMPILFDLDFDAANAYRIQAVPRTLFISKDGMILKDHIGVIEKSDLEKAIEGLIERN